MNYIEEIKKCFHISNIIVSDRSLKANFHYKFEIEEFPKFDEINQLITSFPSRDTIQFQFTDETEEDTSIDNKKVFTKQEYQRIQRDWKYSKYIDVNVRIDKTIEDDTVSIYCYNKFIENCCEMEAEEILSMFGNLLKGRNRIMFEVFDETIDCSKNTKTIIFTSDIDKVVKNIGEEEFCRKNRIDICNKNTSFFHKDEYDLLPQDFHIDGNTMQDKITECFQNLSTLLSAVYISSVAKLSGSICKVEISGQHSVTYEFDYKKMKYNDVLYDLCEWIYSGGSYADKAQITKTILSLSRSTGDISKIDKEIFASIQSNYNLYLKDNAAQYVNMVNDLADFITNTVAKISESGMKIAEEFKTNFKVIVTFFITIVLLNAVSEQPLDNIFTHDVVSIMWMLFWGSIIYFILSCFDIWYKLKRVNERYEELKTCYKTILTDEDIHRVFKNDEIKNYEWKEIKKYVHICAIIWGSFIFALFIAILQVG